MDFKIFLAYYPVPINRYTRYIAYAYISCLLCTRTAYLHIVKLCFCAGYYLLKIMDMSMNMNGKLGSYYYHGT